jgi:Tfp pilus assembly protein PilO
MAPPPAQSALNKIPLAGKFGIGVGLSLLLLFGYWFIFYSDVAGKIEGAERQKKELKTQFVEQQQVQATYFADRGELALREQHARELNKVLPPDAQEDAFLSTIQTASNAAGIELK